MFRVIKIGYIERKVVSCLSAELVSQDAEMRLEGLEMMVGRPVISLGHYVEQRVFWVGPKFLKLCPRTLNYVQNIFPGGAKIFQALRPITTGLMYIKKSRYIQKSIQGYIASVASRTGLRGGGQRGQLPRALRSKGAPRDNIYLF